MNPCPAGYTLSAGTETCYKTSIGCPSGFTLNGGICTSGDTCDCLNIEWSLSGGTSGATLNTQFVGTTDGKRVWLFDVSGETQSIEYRNATNSWLIFEEFSLGTSYQFSSTTECPVSTLTDWVDVGGYTTKSIYRINDNRRYMHRNNSYHSNRYNNNKFRFLLYTKSKFITIRRL